MTIYDKTDWALRNLKGLKPLCCENCRADGCGTGSCSRCLMAQGYNRDLVETTLFVVDDVMRGYHDSYDGHREFKGMLYREKNERPYLYYGIEIEVEFNPDILEVFEYDDYDERADITDMAQSMLREFNKITHGMFIQERDGSLQNGIEFISRPTSYKKWTNPETIELLNKGFEYLKSKGALLAQPDSNGLHIHISSKFFDYGIKDANKAQQAYQDMDWLFQFYQTEIEKIGGREYTSYCASKMSKVKDRYNIGRTSRDNPYGAELSISGKMKKGSPMSVDDHYSAITISGRTIEGRVFNSTVDTEQVLACIEMMRNMAHAVRNGDIVGKTFADILATKESPYLDKVLANLSRAYKDNKDEFNLDKVCQEEMEIK